MRRIDRAILAVLVFFASGLAGAGSARALGDWPPIIPEELALKDNPAQPGALAMVLYREEILNAAKSLDSYYYRVKVFSESGRKYGDVEILYIPKFTEIKEIEGRTVHPDGSIVEFDGQVLDRTLVKFGEFRYVAKTFSMPSITPGSVIEYRYKVQHPTMYLNATWQLQEELYTKRAHFGFTPARTFLGLRVRTISPYTRTIAPQKIRMDRTNST